MGAGVRQGLKWQEAKYIEIPWPENQAKTSICRFLDSKCVELDKAIEAAEVSIEEYKLYKKSVIFQAVTKGLDPNVPMKDSGIEWIGETPSSWRILRIKNLIEERNERSEDGSEELLSVSVNKGVIPKAELSQQTMLADSLVGYKKVYEGDLVFNRLNPEMARFGHSRYEGITSPDFAVFYPRENGWASIKFLVFLLKSPRYVGRIKQLTTGVGEGFSRLYSPQLFGIFVSLPDRDEQDRIVEFLECKCAEIDKALEAKQLIIEELKTYKKSLIWEVVTGKREV